MEELVWLDGFRPVLSVRPNASSGMSAPDYFPVLTDHLGTPRKVLDKNGATRWSWDAKEPFGNTLPQETHGSFGAFKFNLRFPGQWFDQETGLYHNGFRDFHAGLGRYVQSDPLGLEAGWNTYAYVNSNPIIYVDENGLRIREPNINTEHGRYYHHEISRLRRLSPTFDSMYKTISASPYFIFIDAGSYHSRNSFYFSGPRGTVNWNPNIYVVCGLIPNRLHTPIQGLVHEYVHAYNYIDGMIRNGGVPSVTHEERVNTLPMERQIFKEAGMSEGRSWLEYQFGSRQRFKERR